MFICELKTRFHNTNNAWKIFLNWQRNSDEIEFQMDEIPCKFVPNFFGMIRDKIIHQPIKNSYANKSVCQISLKLDYEYRSIFY